MDDLLTELQSAQSDEERQWLVMKFSLDSLDSEVREAVWAAAIPRWFDRNLLAALLEKEVNDEFAKVFDKLLTCSFVETFANLGYDIHDRSRGILLNRLSHDNADRFRELNRRVAEYCLGKDLIDVPWVVAARYHQLLSGTPLGLVSFIQQGIDWINQIQYSNLDALSRPLIKEIEAKRLTGQPAAWVYFFKGRVEIRYAQFGSAKESMNLALSMYSENLALKAEILISIGSAEYMLGRFAEAEQTFDQGLQLFRQLNQELGQANTLFWLGEISRLSRKFDEAKEKHAEAMTLCRKIGSDLGLANSLSALGDIHIHEEQFNEAEQEVNEALELFRKVGDKSGEAGSLKTLGDLHRLKGDFDGALLRYNESLDLARTSGDFHNEANAIARLGESHLARGEYREAKERTEEALKIYERIGVPVGQANCRKTLDEIDGRLNPPDESTG